MNKWNSAGPAARVKAAGKLNHPKILAVYDVETHDGAPYVVYELLEGETLRERCAVVRFRHARRWTNEIVIRLTLVKSPPGNGNFFEANSSQAAGKSCDGKFEFWLPRSAWYATT